MQSTDSRAFCCAGLGESYLNVGQLNLFMVCEQPNAQAFRKLPPGYSIRLCRHDELEKWMHTALQQEWVSVISGYYERVYALRAEEFFSRCTFVCDEQDNPVATCFLWQAYGRVNTLHWFRTLPEAEGRGLGRALLSQSAGRCAIPDLSAHATVFCLRD
ncbi:MAG: GNAT family N-acetyltransferase [Oscillospiraceae bacterium]|nr:GNAT family N-acetyltransferase [Oscillospiraceae bacterium]